MAQKKQSPRKSKPAARAAKNRPAPQAARPRKVSPQVAEIQSVIDVMVERGAVEVELEAKGTRIRVRLKEDRAVSMVPIAAATPHLVAAPAPEAPSAARPAAADTSAYHVFKSPMVGTFYRSPSPDTDPFVEAGSRIGPESTLCILEAMKVMNEIKAEISGKVVEVLAQNGEPVEFGQPLFLIDQD
ncbi:MAG: acetyl-CoA carboxylase biotin carboxyl carrier protein [Planctomycetota bacterium]